MFVERVVVGPYQTNCYILGQDETSSCWIIDPGNDPEAIISCIKKHQVNPVAVLLTHTHWDHITALPAIRKAYPEVEILVGREDANFLGKNAYRHFSETITDRTFLDAYKEQLQLLPEPTTLLDDGQMLDDCHMRVIHTPGHTPGGVCFFHEKGAFLFSGDTLFAGGIGRTDLYGGSYTEIIASLKKLMELPGETRVLPGHGPSTTIAEEQANNPYVGV
jgi:hydroxyacylglutathione hydrolase